MLRGINTLADFVLPAADVDNGEALRDNVGGSGGGHLRALRSRLLADGTAPVEPPLADDGEGAGGKLRR